MGSGRPDPWTSYPNLCSARPGPWSPLSKSRPKQAGPGSGSVARPWAPLLRSPLEYTNLSENLVLGVVRTQSICILQKVTFPRVTGLTTDSIHVPFMQQKSHYWSQPWYRRALKGIIPLFNLISSTLPCDHAEVSMKPPLQTGKEESNVPLQLEYSPNQETSSCTVVTWEDSMCAVADSGFSFEWSEQCVTLR